MLVGKSPEVAALVKVIKILAQTIQIILTLYDSLVSWFIILELTHILRLTYYAPSGEGGEAIAVN